MVVDPTNDQAPPQVDPSRLCLNPVEAMTITHDSIADNGYPLLIVDNLFRDPHYVRDLALSLEFRPPTTAHSHARAQVRASTASLEAFFHRQIGADWCVPADGVLRPKDADQWIFHRSMRSDELKRFTRRSAPHVDDDTVLAAVIYLTDEDSCRGGTGFYKHRATGFEECFRGLASSDPSPRYPLSFCRRMQDAKVLAKYTESGRDLADYGQFWTRTLGSVPYERHLITSNDTWKMTKMVEMSFNRLIIYPAFVLHKPVIDYGWFDDDNERKRRLTQNFWLAAPHC